MGRPPIGKKAMTAAERQQRRRKRLAREKAQQDRGAKRTQARAKNEAPFAAPVTPPGLDTLLGLRFGTIYADPPWLYDNHASRGAASNHYDGMTIEELCALPIRDLAADDAHLHMWTTNAFLFDSLRVMEAWGFEFKSTFVWLKPQMGTGNYWRNSHEIMLTAVRGTAKGFADKSWKSWIKSPRGAHSEKPEFVRSIIERTSPGPYLELFAREAAPGWTVWGNQAPPTLTGLAGSAVMRATMENETAA